ncbi:MAG: DUF1553 domain-containing protein [Planctomycetota bacterium]
MSTICPTNRRLAPMTIRPQTIDWIHSLPPASHDMKTLFAMVPLLLAVQMAWAQSGDSTKPAKAPDPKVAAKAPGLKDFPPAKVDAGALPKAMVLVELCESGLSPDKNLWPESPPAGSEQYPERAFALFRFPQRYIDTGIRADRPNPLFVRASAIVDLPPGKHRFLLRARGASRVTLDGKVVLTTPFPPADPGGHGTIKPPGQYLNLSPDFRFAPPGNREEVIEARLPGGPVVVVLETIVGGILGKSRRRPEPGETVVAWAPEGTSSWRLLSPAGETVPYTDEGWESYQAERNTHLDAVDASARASCRKADSEAMASKRQADARWLAGQAEIALPAIGATGGHPVDRFLESRWNLGAAGLGSDAGEAVALLESKCFQCHSGTKAKGGLRLDSRQALLAGGDSGAAFDPAAPAKGHLMSRLRSTGDDRMPPKGDPLKDSEVSLLARWLGAGAPWTEPLANAAKVAVTPPCDDLTFLRRATFDTVGVPPSEGEVRSYLAWPARTRRAKAVDRLLADPRRADRGISAWLDLLAENPNILNPTLNNTGPFRWWLRESLLDQKPLDLMAMELVRMRGSERYGGPAGFAVASQNDSPMATKGVVLAGAFLGVQLKCARCHDAPGVGRLQEDLFALAAMLAGKEVTVPATSSVPADKLHAGGRKALITVSLKPGSSVKPRWRLDDIVPAGSVENSLADREKLGRLLTSAANERFARVQANRVWRDLMGRGLVEPPDDWDRARPSHPELLAWLGRELVRSGYDETSLRRLIMNSAAYQRGSDPSLVATDPLYRAPARRRLSAEQVVDGLFAASGMPMRLEEVSLDIDGVRDQGNSISLGNPGRAWMLTSTSNERDRPSLSLPRIQAVCDVLEAFGWRGARQDPRATRDDSPEVIQPAILANGTMGLWLTTLTDGHAATAMALEDAPLDRLVERLYLRYLTRKPTPAEAARLAAVLSPGFESRKVEGARGPTGPRLPDPYVSWSNHLDPEATVARQAQEARAKAGDPPTTRLEPGWRGRLENVIWAICNSPEFAHAR